LKLHKFHQINAQYPCYNYLNDKINPELYAAPKIKTAQLLEIALLLSKL
jgi:hypothetical protein